MQGKDIVIVEKLAELGLELEPITRKLLLTRLMKTKPAVYTQSEVLRVEGSRAFVRNPKGGQSQIDFDALIFAVGFTAEDPFPSSEMPDSLEIYRIGDCASPGGILDAIHEGHQAGISI
jgi:NADH dehydrogenase FAD-containing subunit